MFFGNWKKNVMFVCAMVVILMFVIETMTIGFMVTKIKKLNYVIEHREIEEKKGAIDEEADDSSDGLDRIRRKLK